MKAHLLHRDREFDFTAMPPPNADYLAQDLELGTLLGAMAAGDKFRYQVCEKVLLASLTEPEAIRYRQGVLADCIARPDIVRQIYDIAVGALNDKRGVWGFLSAQNPAVILSGAVNQLEVLITRLRQLRQVADEHASTFRSDGFAVFFQTVRRELDDDYFETLVGHLKHLRFADGELLSAQLGRDNNGISYVLRSGNARRGWRDLHPLHPRGRPRAGQRATR